MDIETMIRDRILDLFQQEAKEMENYIDNVIRKKLDCIAIKPDEAAQLIDVSKKTIITLIVDGKLKALKIGTLNSKRPTYRILLRDLYDCLEALKGDKPA